MKNLSSNIVVRVILAILAGLVAAININSFVAAGALVPGGFSGLSLMIVRIAETSFNIKLNYSFIYLLFNIPCTILVFNAVGRKFTYVSLVDVVATSLFVELIPTIYVTNDILLISVFGGILGGVSGALMLLAGGCGGGTDFVGIYYAKKKQKSMWNTIFAFNAAMLIVTGLMYGWDISLYSIIFQYVQTQVLDIYDSRYKRSCFIIITDKPEEIRQAVYEKYNHSVTHFTGVGGYSHQNKNVLYTVVGKYEEQDFINLIMRVDPKAFVNIMDSERVIGNFNQKPY